ncbi:MAG TPA: hypothetical protein VMF08_04220 [Candidatus Sulfotelmatobacter sp.]|nr:hypothetical protein [Candidatus Sulfotelmatobacter sp.]
MPDIQYKRLTRSRMAPGRLALAVRTRSSLWLGPDHLLRIDAENFRENYKRFYYRDIQAILVQKTDGFRNWNIILGIVVAGLFVLTLSLIASSGARWTSDTIGTVCFFGFIVALFVLILVLHIVAGPTCRTYLRTAVQIEELSSLGRIKMARHALAEIHPFIVAAQGGALSPESVVAQMREWTAPTAPAQAIAPTAPAATVAPTVTPSESVVSDPIVPPRINP